MAKKSVKNVHKSFSALESLSFGWHSLQDHFGKAVGMSTLYLFCLIILMGVSLVAESVFMPGDSLGTTAIKLVVYGAFRILISIVAIALSLGFFKASLGFVNNKPQWKDLRVGLQVWPVLSYFFGQLIYNFVVLIAMMPIVLIFMLMGYLLGNTIVGMVVGYITAIPVMVYVLLEFFLFPYFIVDKNAGPIRALQYSSKICRGNKWSLLGLFLMIIFLNVGGVLAFGIGLLITIPWTFIATAHAYIALRDARLNIY